MSNTVTVLPFRLSSMRLSDPVRDGPPDARSALSSVENDETVYAPGLCAFPVTYTRIELNFPIERFI